MGSRAGVKFAGTRFVGLRFVGTGLMGLGLTLGAFVVAAGPGSAAVVGVAVNDYYFDPNSLSGLPGDTISFENVGSNTHQVVAADGSFNSGPLAPGDSFSFTLGDQPMAFACALHSSMTGTIAVQAGGATTTTMAAPVSIAATSTTDATLAVTGSNSTATAVLAFFAVGVGAALLLAHQRRRTLVSATVASDALLPAREHDRRDRVRKPPAEF